MTMIAAIGVLAEFGFESALIQRQDATRIHYDTAWTLGLLRGACATVVSVQTRLLAFSMTLGFVMLCWCSR